MVHNRETTKLTNHKNYHVHPTLLLPLVTRQHTSKTPPPKRKANSNSQTQVHSAFPPLNKEAISLREHKTL